MVQSKKSGDDKAVEAATEMVGKGLDATVDNQDKPVKLTPEQLQKVSALEVPRIDDDQLRDLSSYEEALQFAAQMYDNRVIDLSEELGTGFDVLDDKEALVDTSFLIIAFRFNNSAEYGGMFVSAVGMTESGKKFILNDGSAGIRDQLMDMAQRSRQFGGYLVKKGLRKSEYATCPPGHGGCGRPRTSDELECSTPNCGYTGDARGKGATYYLNL